MLFLYKDLDKGFMRVLRTPSYSKKSSRVKLINISNLRERVYEVVKKIIVSQEIAPGEKIDEEGLAKQLGVSRTPLRECLCRLENEGLIEIIPRRGAFVIKHSKDKIIEILLVREVLEGLAARLAAEHIDEQKIGQMKSLFEDFNTLNVRDRYKEYTKTDLEFHTLILNASRNSFLMSYMNILNGHIHMLRQRTEVLQGGAEQSLSEHHNIIQALEKRDPLLSETLMREHIRMEREDISKYIGKD